MPFSVPVNLAGTSPDNPGLGMTIAQGLHGKFLEYDAIPIVEVSRQLDWPGKKEEFFGGNFGAISLAREAGYDLVLVGFLNPLTSAERLTAQVKLIEVEAGVTLWYGEVTATTYRNFATNVGSRLGLIRDTPATGFHFGPVMEELEKCIAHEVLREDTT